MNLKFDPFEEVIMRGSYDVHNAGKLIIIVSKDVKL